MKHTLISFLLLLVIQFHSLTAQTDGALTFSVRTTTNSGFYSPENILAIWLETSSGTFVRTFKVRAANRIQHLYTWKVASSLNMADAITGPTLPNHTTHFVTWNCRNLNNELMPDENYRIRVEFTEEHQQGPLATYTFTKGSVSQTLNFPDQSYFKDAVLTYNAITGIVQTASSNNPVVFPNPFNESVSFSFQHNCQEPNFFRIFDRNGTLVYYSEISSGISLNHTFEWSGNTSSGETLPAGTYFYSFQCKEQHYTGKILFIR
jgi:flagellar hook assembly protein FlgD